MTDPSPKEIWLYACDAYCRHHNKDLVDLTCSDLHAIDDEAGDMAGQRIDAVYEQLRDDGIYSQLAGGKWK